MEAGDVLPLLVMRHELLIFLLRLPRLVAQINKTMTFSLIAHMVRHVSIIWGDSFADQLAISKA